MMHERSKRLAANEAVFRAGNKAIDANLSRYERSRRVSSLSQIT